jgi:glycosyltransferase involved in cell wall biosynthesis
MENKKIKILVVPSDRTGVSYFRSTKPHLHLQKMYPDKFHVDIDYEPQLNNDTWLKQYDIIHYHRTLGDYEQMEALVERLKGLGIVSIMDLDDYWFPGVHHPAHHIIKNNEIHLKIASNLRTAENVMTTTSIFANKIKKLNKNTFVIPNSIDINEKQYIPNPEPSDKIRIGWLGGSAHLRDLELLRGLVSKLKSDGLLDKIQFVICGFDLRGKMTNINKDTGEQTSRDITPQESVWYEYEKIFTNNYTSISPEYKNHLLKFKQEEFPGVADEPYRRVWTKNISDYATNYNLFDISLAPLETNMFNEMKSQLKVIESGFHKKAIIAQNFGPYTLDLENAYQKGGEIDETKNALLVDTHRNHKSWHQYLKKLIQNPELIDKLANNLHETVVSKYSLDVVTETRKEYYLKLLKNVKKGNEKLVNQKN